MKGWVIANEGFFSLVSLGREMRDRRRRDGDGSGRIHFEHLTWNFSFFFFPRKISWPLSSFPFLLTQFDVMGRGLKFLQLIQIWAKRGMQVEELQTPTFM